MQNSKKQRMKRELRNLVSGYLDVYVKTPSLETVGRNFFIQARLAELLVLIKSLSDLVIKQGTDFDSNYLCNLSGEELIRRLEQLKHVINSGDHSHIKERVDTEDIATFMYHASSKKFLLAYLTREINWIIISILSASYVSSLVLMRSVFELIIGIATQNTDKMSIRINDIAFLDASEKRKILKLWRCLCAWGHPYGKWLKEICPVYSSRNPVYNKTLSKMCLKEFENIIDFFIVVALAKFEIRLSKFVAMLKTKNIDTSNLKLVRVRLKNYKIPLTHVPYSLVEWENRGQNGKTKGLIKHSGKAH